MPKGKGDPTQGSGDKNKEKALHIARRRWLQIAGSGIAGGALVAGNVTAEDSDLPNTIVIDGTVSRGKSKYEFKVSGSVEPHDEIGTVDGNDTIDGNHVTGAVHRDKDAYRFSGHLTYLEVKGDAEVSLTYGDEDDIEADRIEIVASDDGDVDYEFTSTDRIEKVLDNGDYSADDDDEVFENDDGTWTVDGSTENGNGDTYDFWGEIEHFEPVTGEFTLFINGEETTVTELTGQEPDEDTYPLTIDDFDGGTIREEWGNAANYDTTDAYASVGSHSAYRVDGSSLYDDGTGFDDTFQEGGRFIAWSVYVDEVDEYTSTRIGFNADGPPAPTDFNELTINVSDEELRFRENIDGERIFHEVVPISFTPGEWHDIVAWWGYDTIECWVYDETGEKVGHLQADSPSYQGEYWWLFDQQQGDGAVIDNIRFHEEHPYTGRLYKADEPPEGIYIAPDGDDATGDGTIENPYYSPNAAFDELEAMSDPVGERIICRGGTYYPMEEQLIANVRGTENNPIVMEAYPNEHPEFDFSEAGDVWTTFRFYGMEHFEMRDLEVHSSYHSDTHEGHAVRARRCHNCVFENLNIHHHSQTGLTLSASDNNLVTGCELHHNVDQDHSGADGIAIIDEAGDNTIEYCDLHHNVDDGYDTWGADPGNTVRYCSAWRNGYVPETGEITNAWTAGYKARYGTEVHHCIAFNNTRGFGTGRSPIGGTFHNCTGFSNEYYDFHSDAKELEEGVFEFRNCISVGNNTALDTEGTDDRYNSWNLGIEDPQFVSEDVDDELFLHLREDSPAVDAGVDVEYEYGGTAPDLGMFDRELDTEALL